jgi:phage gp36-like protein
MAGFANTDDMIQRYDSRTLGDLVTDDGTRVAEASLKNNDKLQTALDSATGQVLAAALRADRYTKADLLSLTGESREYLVDITCAIAFWNLWRRKPYTDLKDQQTAAQHDAKDALEMLRSGDHIFDVATVRSAGIPKIETVTKVQAEEWSLFLDIARAGHFYPVRRTFRNR